MEWGINLKSRFFKGITFRTWLYFSTFAVGILALLWILQISFLKPYYKSNKVNAIKTIVNQVNAVLETNKDITNTTDNIAYSNNVCFAIYTGNYKVALSVKDGIGGVSCYLSENSHASPFQKQELMDFIDQIKASETGEAILELYNEKYGKEVFIYGTKIKNPLTDYYLIIHSEIEPEDYSIKVLQNQFIMVSFLVIIFAAGVSLLISRGMAKPIVKMTSSARGLADGNYNVDFPTSKNSYAEMNDLADALNHATAELSKMDELRRDLIANVSHDIKTPLTMIKAYAEMIQDFSGDDKNKRNEHLDVIITEANHLDRLVIDMLELSKIQSGAMELNVKRFDLAETTTNILKIFEATLKEQKIKLITNFVKPSYVEADEIKIGQVIYNFFNNALKYVGEDKELIVTIEKVGKKYKVSVIDHGIGISEENIPYIWDRYYKIDKNFKRNQESTGLGLAISKGLLMAHNATYGVTSKEGEGSTFWFELPISK